MYIKRTSKNNYKLVDMFGDNIEDNIPTLELARVALFKYHIKLYQHHPTNNLKKALIQYKKTYLGG